MVLLKMSGIINVRFILVVIIIVLSLSLSACRK